MKKLIFNIITIAALFAAPMHGIAQEEGSAQTHQPLQLTLDQALEIALSENNTVKIADMTVEKTGYAKKGSYASLYPNINISGSYQRTLLKQVMVMEMPNPITGETQTAEIKMGRRPRRAFRW